MYNKENDKPSPKRDIANNISSRKHAATELTCPPEKQEFAKKDAWNDSTSSSDQPKWILKASALKPVNKKIDKEKEICPKEELNTSTSSSSSQASIPHENVPTKDVTTLTTKRVALDNRITSSELIGFSETSSLSVIRDCTDSPSIMCHCKKTSQSAPVLKNRMTLFKSCEYETAPTLTNTSGLKETQRTTGVKTIRCDEANSPHENACQVESGCQHLCDSPQLNKDKCLLIKCHCQLHNCSRDVNVQRHGVTRIDSVRNEEMGVQTETSLKQMCSCHPSPNCKIDSSENSIPELYAAKVKVGFQDIPKQFIFNAVKTPSHAEAKRQNGFGKIFFGKEHRRFSIFNSSKKKKSPKFTKIEENWSSEAQDLKKDQQITAQGDDDLFIHTQRPERIEVYYFDHGCSGYFRTTDQPPLLHTDIMVEKVNMSATRFWAEIFGVFHVATTFIIAFILQLLRFIFYSIIRPLVVGVIQMTSDYLFKPILAILFNAILQPIFIFNYNIISSLKDICELVAQAIGYFLREIANVCRAIRLVEVKNSTKNGPFCSSAPYNYKTEV